METLFLYLASIGLSVCAAVFAHSPIQNLHALIKNFWFLITGSILCITCTMVFESPKLPNNALDLFLCVAYALAASMSTLTFIISLNYISAVLFTIITSIEIPLLLVAQQTILTDIGPYSAGPFQITGAFLVFLAVITRPVLEIYSAKCRKDVDNDQGVVST